MDSKHVVEVPKPRDKPIHINDLGSDILVLLFTEFLTTDDRLHSVCRVCKLWNRLEKNCTIFTYYRDWFQPVKAADSIIRRIYSYASLKKLRVNAPLDDTQVQQIAERFPFLKTLDFIPSSATPLTLSTLNKLGSLESLTISYMPRKPIYRNLFLPSLTKLSLLECYSCVNDRTLDEIIARLPSLKILEVHDCALFRPNISSPTLQELHIASAVEGISIVANYNPSIRCPNLKKLTLNTCEGINDSYLSRTAAPLLEEVSIIECSFVTSEGVDWLLQRCPNVSKLTAFMVTCDNWMERNVVTMSHSNLREFTCNKTAAISPCPFVFPNLTHLTITGNFHCCSDHARNLLRSFEPCFSSLRVLKMPVTLALQKMDVPSLCSELTQMHLYCEGDLPLFHTNLFMILQRRHPNIDIFFCENSH